VPEGTRRPSQALHGALRLDDETPSAVVYDLAWLKARSQELQAALPGFRHCVALKAAPYRGLIERFGGWGFGFEAASFPEALCAHTACPQATLLYDSPAKTRQEIARAEALGWRLSANSLTELARMQPGASLRVNTQVGAGRIAHTSVADARSRFGEPFDSLPATLPCAGLHAHVGSQGCSLDQLAASAARLVSLAEAHPEIQWLNIGGGVPAQARYADYAQSLQDAAPALFSGRWPVYTELGRSLLADAARAYSRIEYIERGVATIHLGADFLLRRIYRPDDWHYPMQALGPDFAPLHGEAVTQTIAGPLCFAGDVLGTVDAPPLHEGDLIEIGLAGAYTMSMWSRHCSRRMPPVHGLETDGRLVTISAGESNEDVLRLWRTS
jgi:diaminopimelate decarboxylase